MRIIFGICDGMIVVIAYHVGQAYGPTSVAWPRWYV
jgi:hypothetical protein